MTSLNSQCGHSSNPSNLAISISFACLTFQYKDRSCGVRERFSSDSGNGNLHPDWSMQTILKLRSPRRLEA